MIIELMLSFGDCNQLNFSKLLRLFGLFTVCQASDSIWAMLKESLLSDVRLSLDSCLGFLCAMLCFVWQQRLRSDLKRHQIQI
jgi:hypothetical protein